MISDSTLQKDLSAFQRQRRGPSVRSDESRSKRSGVTPTLRLFISIRMFSCYFTELPRSTSWKLENSTVCMRVCVCENQSHAYSHFCTVVWTPVCLIATFYPFLFIYNNSSSMWVYKCWCIKSFCLSFFSKRTHTLQMKCLYVRCVLLLKQMIEWEEQNYFSLYFLFAEHHGKCPSHVLYSFRIYEHFIHFCSWLVYECVCAFTTRIK